VRLEGLDHFEKSNDIGNRTRDLPACVSIVPQSTTLPRAPKEKENENKNKQTKKICKKKVKQDRRKDEKKGRLIPRQFRAIVFN
jgi:hypothetical protein